MQFNRHSCCYCYSGCYCPPSFATEVALHFHRSGATRCHSSGTESVRNYCSLAFTLVVFLCCFFSCMSSSGTQVLVQSNRPASKQANSQASKTDTTATYYRPPLIIRRSTLKPMFWWPNAMTQATCAQHFWVEFRGQSWDRSGGQRYVWNSHIYLYIPT